MQRAEEALKQQGQQFQDHLVEWRCLRMLAWLFNIIYMSAGSGLLSHSCDFSVFFFHFSKSMLWRMTGNTRMKVIPRANLQRAVTNLPGSVQVAMIGHMWQRMRWRNIAKSVTNAKLKSTSFCTVVRHSAFLACGVVTGNSRLTLEVAHQVGWMASNGLGMAIRRCQGNFLIFGRSLHLRHGRANLPWSGWGVPFVVVSKSCLCLSCLNR